LKNRSGFIEGRDAHYPVRACHRQEMPAGRLMGLPCGEIRFTAAVSEGSLSVFWSLIVILRVVRKHCRMATLREKSSNEHWNSFCKFRREDLVSWMDTPLIPLIEIRAG
jgi:hypothetical protein